MTAAKPARNSARMVPTWQNWGRNVRVAPSRIAHPSTTAEVQELVRAAAADGDTVKAIGAGHSFTPVAATDGTLLHLGRMNRILGHDPATGRVRIQAGATLRELNPQLAALGLAFPNLGDVDPQSIAGAVATGTHGTGGHLHGIADAIVGVQLVTADGDIVDIDESHPWFQASRVSLGALGIVTEVTVQLVPSFLLHAREEPMPLGEVIARLDELVDDNDHFEFYWFPHTEKTSTKRNNRVPTGTKPEPLNAVRAWVDDEFISNTVFEAVNRIAARQPEWIPRINAISGSALSARQYTDASYRVFVTPRRVRFRESEFAIPRAALPEALGELKQWLDTHDERVSFPIEVRFTAADDVWMSTGYRRDNAYIAVHQYYQSDYRRYFSVAQDILTAYDGRPHWGKLHSLDADYFTRAYPRFNDFVAVRDEADPNRRFTNAYLDRVLG